MTTLDIGRLHIDNPNIKNKTLDEIKLFLTQVLESDMVSSMTIKKNTKWDKVDKELRNLSIVDTESAKELGNSLNILSKEAQTAECIDHKTARDEYLTQKYSL